MKSINQESNQVFNFTRYAYLLKNYLIEQGKTLGLYTLTLVLLSIMVGGLIGYHCGDSYNAEVGTVTMLMYIMISYSVCFAFSGSLMFSSSLNRSSRIKTYMLPGSLFEKYMVRFTVYFLIFGVCYVASMLLGELTRYIMTDSDYNFVSVFAFDSVTLCEEIKNSVFTKIVLFAIGSALELHSFYALGSSLWPSKSFFKTFAVTFIIMNVLMVMVPFIDFIDINRQVTTGIIVCEYVLAIVFYFLAWLRFSTTQIVQRFMMN